MKTVLQIIEEAGGLRPGTVASIENPPWMRLVIEVLEEPGPEGHDVISVAHYGEQNADPMRDPEMLFEVVERDGVPELWPFYFRNDYVAVEHWSRFRVGDGEVVCLPRRTQDMESFASLWDRNLKEQGFVDAFREQKGAVAEGSI